MGRALNYHIFFGYDRPKASGGLELFEDIPMLKHFGKQTTLLGVMATATGLFASGAQATVEISSKATKDMSCSGGVCAPTATNAVLNAGDLETMLASGNVTVTTTNSKVQADNIEVADALTWSGSTTLSLSAYDSISVNSGVSVKGQGGMSLTTNDGGKNGTLWFSQKGNITFSNLSSQLSINGISFTLASDIKTLASDITSNPSGDFALANSFNAKDDGTYDSSPLPGFGGMFTGLGNTISGLSIKDTNTSDSVGLFYNIYAGVVENLNVTNAKVVGPTGTSNDFSVIGILAGSNAGVMSNDAVSGSVTSGTNSNYTNVGGVVGWNGN